MFVDDQLHAPVRLAKGGTLGDRSVASLNVVGRYRAQQGHLQHEGWVDRGELDAILDEALWEGTSVCARGHALGPSQAPYRNEVSLRVDQIELTVHASGDRRWTQRGEALVPGEAAPFERVPLTYHVAFGGQVVVPPGPAPGTGRPHPGGTFTHPTNPTGRGFYPSARDAVDQLLPNVEWCGRGVRSWADRPEPAGLGLCLDLHALRVGGTPPDSVEAWMQTMLRSKHPGGPRTIFRELQPGAYVAIGGAVRAPASFALPDAPLAVHVTRRGGERRVRARPRAVLVDVDTGWVEIAWGAAFSWSRESLAGDVRVTRGSGV